jgi:acyl-CoA synthetase (AMP-forming)/AMP-acid ligase II
VSTGPASRPAAPPPWWEDIHGAVSGLARRCPDRPAVVDGTTTMTFAELKQAAERHRIVEGTDPAPVQVIPARSSAGFFVEVLAAWLRGRTPMPLPARAPADQLDGITRQLAAISGECRPWKAVTAVSGGRYRPLVTHGEPPTEPRKAEALGLRPGGAAFFASPMHLNGPFEFAFRHLLRGGTVVVAPRFDPAMWVAMTAAHRPDWAFAVPTQMRRLLAAVDLPALRAATTTLELLVHSSEPCPAELWSRFADLLGAERLAEYYGATCYDGTFVRGAAGGGLPIEGAQLRVVDDRGRPVPPGTVGTIDGRSRAGLVNHEPGMCRTPACWQTVGDRGRLTTEGRLVLDSVATRGRAIVGGINVALARVEAVLAAHPGLLASDVRAVPDGDYGTVVAVHAYTGDPLLTANAVHAYCAARLSSAERPRHIELTPAEYPVADHAAGWS